MRYSTFAHDGLILAAQVLPHVDEYRSLRRDVDHGVLVKLRRGTFVERSTWDAADARERHILHIRAVLAAAQRPVVVAGASAAAVWGMPVGTEWPSAVTVLDEWLGGGRSEPGVRRTAAGHKTAHSVVRQGIQVTDLARTTIDVARSTSTELAMGSVDWALWRRNPEAITKLDLIADLERLALRSHRRRVERVIGDATSLSDSYGESRARVVIRQLGYVEPELQVEFRDAEGKMSVDFFWAEAGVVVEFDGKQKYTRDEFTGGDPGEVVWREKKREDRLRRLGLVVVRILWSDLKHPELLARRLADAGVPRNLAHGSSHAVR